MHRSQGLWPLTLTALALLAITMTSTQAQAQVPSTGDFGAGIILGEPSGLTGKLWFNPSNALDVHLAFDFTDEAVAIFSDYTYHFDLIKLRSNVQVELPFYVGIGGKLLVDANSDNENEKDAALTLGARIPLGMSVLFKKAPLEIFLEIAPGLRVVPKTSGDLDGGIGVRYYFH